MRIEAIIFDKDGTLFDFQATWGDPFQKFLDQVAPGENREEAALAMGFDLQTGNFRRNSVVIAGTDAEVAEVLAPIVGRDLAEITRLLFDVSNNAERKPAVPLASCLAALGERFVLGVVTNAGEDPARKQLRGEGVLHFFDFIAGHDSGFGAKPGPGQLLAFAEATGTSPANTLMVGDSRHDLQAARAAGMIPVAVLTGIATEADLADLAHVILPDIGHLDAWIDTLPA